MKPIRIIITLLLITCSLISIKFIAGGNAESSENDSFDLSEIENAIIIKGIESDLNNSAIDDDNDGAIIYDDSFFHITSEIKEINKSDSITDKKEYIKSLINILKKKDNKWHVTEHKIRKGENLWSIAKKFNTDYKIIIKANRIDNPDLLKYGNIIYVPNRNGITYKIARCDTLSEISNKYGVKQDIIAFQNNINNPSQ